MKRKYLLSSLVVAAAFASGAAQAAVTTYIGYPNYTAWSDQVNWASIVQDNFNDNALAGTQALTDLNTQGYAGPIAAFSNYAGPGIPTGIPVTITPSGINYLSDANMYLIDAAFGTQPNPVFVGTGFDNALNVYGFGAGSTGVMKITAPEGSGYAVFGLELGASETVDSTFSVQLFTGGTGGIGGTNIGTFNSNTLKVNPTGTFFGAVSTTPISYALITPAAGRFSVDNVVFGGVASTGVPEPSSIALLGLGLAALGWKARRKATV